MLLRPGDGERARSRLGQHLSDARCANRQNAVEHQRPPGHHIHIGVIAHIQAAGNRLRADRLHINRGIAR